MRCQMKRIEMCFIALHSLGANDYNHLTNVIGRWKYFQIFFSFFSGLPSLSAGWNPVRCILNTSINHLMLFEIVIIGF